MFVLSKPQNRFSIFHTDMNTFFGPRRRNRRIRNLLVGAGLVVLAFLAYKYLVDDDDSSNTSSSAVATETDTDTGDSTTLATPVATPTPSDPDSVILTREYELSLIHISEPTRPY